MDSASARLSDTPSSRTAALFRHEPDRGANAPLGGPRIRAVWAPGTSGAGHGLISAMKIISGPNRKNERGNSDSALKTYSLSLAHVAGFVLRGRRCALRIHHFAHLTRGHLQRFIQQMRITLSGLRPRVTEQLPDGRQRHTSID